MNLPKMNQPSRIPRWQHRWIVIIALISLVVCGAGIAVAIGGTGESVYVPQLSVNVPVSKISAFDHAYGIGRTNATVTSTNVSAPPVALNVVPAETFNPQASAGGPFPADALQINNVWMTSDGVTLVEVFAGRNPLVPSEGRMIIFRTNYETTAQTTDVVNVPQAGTVTIVNAPAGASVETSAQVGDISFETASGTTGELDLANDTLTIAGQSATTTTGQTGSTVSTSDATTAPITSTNGDS